MKSVTRQQNYSILFLLSLVFIFGVPAALSLLVDKSDGKSAVSKPLKKVAMGRNPASSNDLEEVGSKSGALSTTPSNAIVQKIDCDASIDLGQTQGAHIRLRTGDCGGFVPKTIVNRANGYTGETMVLNNGEFTSDYIDLKEGPNLIEVHRIGIDGTTQSGQKLKIRRTPAVADDSH